MWPKPTHNSFKNVKLRDKEWKMKRELFERSFCSQNMSKLSIAWSHMTCVPDNFFRGNSFNDCFLWQRKTVLSSSRQFFLHRSLAAQIFFNVRVSETPLLPEAIKNTKVTNLKTLETKKQTNRLFVLKNYLLRLQIFSMYRVGNVDCFFCQTEFFRL